MSYDLTFFKVPTGTDAKTAFQELMQEEESTRESLFSRVEYAFGSSESFGMPGN